MRVETAFQRFARHYISSLILVGLTGNGSFILGFACSRRLRAVSISLYLLALALSDSVFLLALSLISLEEQVGLVEWESGPLCGCGAAV